MSSEDTRGSLARRVYIPGLDGIRAIAIALVLFSHSVIYDQFSWIEAGHNSGFTGVGIFFVLSGYLITRLLLREEEQTGNISLRLFYLRRALRLFPALWLYLLVVWVLWFCSALPHHSWHSFVTSLLYVRNLVGRGHETGHLWSLSIEEQFYLLWPLILRGLPRRNTSRLMIAIGLIVAITLWRCYATSNGLASAGSLYIRSDFRFDAPLFGCVLAFAERAMSGTIGRLNSTAARSDLLMVGGLVSLGLWIGFKLSEVVYPGTDATVVSLIGIVLVLSQIGVQGRISGLLTWRPLVGLGQISYGLYIWQQLFLGPRTPELHSLRVFPLGLIATVAVAILSYRCLERPLLKLKDKMFS